MVGPPGRERRAMQLVGPGENCRQDVEPSLWSKSFSEEGFVLADLSREKA